MNERVVTPVDRSVPWARFPALLLLPHGLSLFAAALLLVLTPTLNADDLLIAEWAAASLPQGWGATLSTVFFNTDLGVTQIRTYGLARAIQYVHTGLLGAAPLPAYTFLILLHAVSGWLVYKVTKRCGGDALTAFFAALTWVASPAALPLLKVQHHFLYLIAPYYALLGWLLLSGTRQQTVKSFCGGSLLLTAAWLLGEGVLVAIFVTVLAASLYSGSWRRALYLAGQGGVAAFLLAMYIGYQYVFIRDPDLPQRFNFAPSAALGDRFAAQLWENGRGIVGLAHRDSELGTTLGGIDPFGSPIFWSVLVVLTASGLAACLGTTRSRPVQDRKISLMFAWMCTASLGVYLLFTMSGMGTFAPRYSAAFFALMPVAVIVAISAHSRSKAGQVASSVVASLTIALSLTLLYRAEVLVSEPNRRRLADLQGRIVLLRPDTALDLNTVGGMSGLVDIRRNGLPDPMRSLWFSDVALRLHADALLGTTCRMVSDGRAELFLLEHSRGVYPLHRFSVVGPTLKAATACKLSVARRADQVSQPELANGLKVMQGRVLTMADAYVEITPTATGSRYFVHPGPEKPAIIEFDVSGLSSLTLSPTISKLNSDCLKDPAAGIVNMSYAVDGRRAARLLVSRDYRELHRVDLTGAQRMTFTVDQGNGVTTCDWLELGFFDVLASKVR